jgi:hypothetical protein
MKDLWNKLTNFINDWSLALVAVFVGLIMIGGVHLQSSMHEFQIDQLKKIHNIELDMNNQRLNQTLKAGDALYKVYQHEKAKSDLKDSILDEQRIIIQRLIRQIEEYKKWENVDPNSIA